MDIVYFNLGVLLKKLECNIKYLRLNDQVCGILD